MLVVVIFPVTFMAVPIPVVMAMPIFIIPIVVSAIVVGSDRDRCSNYCLLHIFLLTGSSSGPSCCVVISKLSVSLDEITAAALQSIFTLSAISSLRRKRLDRLSMVRHVKRAPAQS
jgi:hypothetical protein